MMKVVKVKKMMLKKKWKEFKVHEKEYEIKTVMKNLKII